MEFVVLLTYGADYEPIAIKNRHHCDWIVCLCCDGYEVLLFRVTIEI